MNNPPLKKTQLTVRIPDEIIAKADEYINRRRFESRSDMIAHVLEIWLESERDDELWEVAQKHEQWDGESPHPYGCDGEEPCRADQLDQVDGPPDVDENEPAE